MKHEQQGVLEWLSRNVRMPRSEKGRIGLATTIAAVLIVWLMFCAQREPLFALVAVFVFLGLTGTIYYFIWRVFPPTYKEGTLKNKFAVNVQPWFTLATAFVAFGSIILSARALDQAREMAFIQTRPYIAIENLSFEVTYRASDVEARDGCNLVIPISNSGSIPATRISTALEVEFKDRNNNDVRLTTNPDPHAKPNDLGNIPITVSTYSAAISPKQSRKWFVNLLIDKADSRRIEEATPLMLHATIKYSAPGIDKTWTYEMRGVLIKKSFGIFDENIT